MGWNSQNNFVVLIIQAGTGFSGLFVYSPAPGAGNLIASITAQAGTDPYGNPYKQGVTDYNNSTKFFSELNNGAVLVGSYDVTSLITQAAQLVMAQDAFAASTAPSAQLISPEASSSPSIITMLGGSQDGTKLPQVTITSSAAAALTTALLDLQGVLGIKDVATPAAPPSGASLLFSTAGTPQLERPSAWAAALLSGLTDSTNRTVTQAAQTQLGGQFTIPANDAAVGTCYRYHAGGTGQWGSTQQQLTVIEALAGANVNQFNVAATTFAANDPVDWDLWMQIVIKSTGAGGTCSARLALDICKNNAASGTNITGVRRAASVAINTTVANTFELDALWASTVGAPTISCNDSTFERIGP